ncbi:hypothetical protein ACHQM5_027054 [Ranunculus cassubicifolius]
MSERCYISRKNCFGLLVFEGVPGCASFHTGPFFPLKGPHVRQSQNPMSNVQNPRSITIYSTTQSQGFLT